MEERGKNGELRTTTHPKDAAGYLSKLLFCWQIPFLVKNFGKNVDGSDLFGPLKKHESGSLGDKVEEVWNNEIANSKNPSLWKVLVKTYRKDFCICGLRYLFIELAIKIPQPLFLAKILQYFVPEQTAVTKSDTYVYASFIVLLSFFRCVLHHSYLLKIQHLGMRMRLACGSLIYRKSLKLSKDGKYTAGDIVNLLANDVKFFEEIAYLHALWVTPVQVAVVMYLLVYYFDLTAVAGIGGLCLFSFLNIFMAKQFSKSRRNLTKERDKRIRLLSEIVTGIKIIKMYTWERPFSNLVEAVRSSEGQYIQTSLIIAFSFYAINMVMSKMALFLCIVSFILTGNSISSQYVYVVGSFYDVLKVAVGTALPLGLTQIANLKVSVGRIETFLKHIDARQTKFPLLRPPSLKQQKNITIQMKNVFTKWNNTSSNYVLRNLDFEASSKDLIAVVGPVGSGKTALLQLILKEIPVLNGDLQVEGTISYASQEPWIFSSTIKQNIVFGEEIDEKKYKKVVKSCSLEQDFSLFPLGDRAFVGERGVMLSGGQKSRINLARSIYRDADIYLLDDPLSAVDAKVGQKIFQECILGYLRNKCVILVTHQLQYLKTVKIIYLVHNGKLRNCGNYFGVISYNSNVLKLLQNSPSEEKDTKNEEFQIQESCVANYQEFEETQQRGDISLNVYRCYFFSGKHYFLFSWIVLLFLASQITNSLTDYFLAIWVSFEEEEKHNCTSTHPIYEEILHSSNNVYIYTGFLVTAGFLTTIRSLNFAILCSKISKNLHNEIFSKLLRVRMRFFDTNSSGRILNRFSKDMAIVDENLPIITLDILQIALSAVTTIIFISVVNTWILIPGLLLFILFYYYRKLFVASSRDLKRIDNTTRSPIYSHLTESLQGLTTIRSSQVQRILEMEFDSSQDVNSSPHYLFIASSGAFGFWLDLHSVLFTTSVMFSFLLAEKKASVGDVGFAITQSLILIGSLQWGMKLWSDLDNNMTSVEHIVEYKNLPFEIDGEVKRPPKAWPSKGHVIFRNVQLKYSEKDPPVLKNINFEILPCEKVGIIGRTGAGKSSLITALFRLAPVEGEIIIDGVFANKTPLECWRSKISIIPQEPILFSGNFRKNLDPDNRHTDSRLWKVLEEVGLKNVIAGLANGLDSNVAEGGLNFSVGQRQLLCLARAMIGNNKILVLDEATANVDLESDQLIQETIRKKFKNCSVITVAHRLYTIMDSDKILVVDRGQIIEAGKPDELLRNEEGAFSQLVRQSGQRTTDDSGTN